MTDKSEQGSRAVRRGKDAERDIAKLLDCSRTWWAPQDFGGGGNPDNQQAADELYCGESKHRSELPKWLKDAMQQTVDNAKDRAGMPVLVLHEHNQVWDDAMICMPLGVWRQVIHPLLLNNYAEWLRHAMMIED